MSTYYEDYLDFKFYSGKPDKDGFYRFKNEDQFYFSYIEDGQVIFCSEGYVAESGRDNGIQSVKKNMVLEERYKTVQLPDGKWIVSLKAGNRQEIAVSNVVVSEEAALALFPRERKKAISAKKSTTAKTTKSSGDEDDYMVCGEYEEQFDKSKLEDGLIAFQHENTKQHYFAWYNLNGDVILRSEAYPTIAARNNGMKSVIKNRMIPERFKVEKKRGLFYLILKAGNHQEIGRSCPKKTEDEAWGLIRDTNSSKNLDPMKLDSTPSSKPKTKKKATKVTSQKKLSSSDANLSKTNLKSSKTSSSAKVGGNAKKATAEGNANTGSSLKDNHGCSNWLWALLALLLLVLLFFLWRGWSTCGQLDSCDRKTCCSKKKKCCKKRDDTTVNLNDGLDSLAMAAKAKWEATLGALSVVDLPDGTSIQVPNSGVERDLIAFLDGGCQGDLKATWFNMDRVLFNVGSSTLNSISNDQIKTIVAISNAYPNAEFKVGGYTDNTGSVEINNKVSSERAAAVMNAIIGGGIDSARLSYEGYGPQHPVCPENDTEECKAKNRRVALRVVKCN